MNQHHWSGQEIAIVGMSFRLPGATDRRAFWTNLRSGIESITTRTSSELQAFGVVPSLYQNPHFVTAVGRLDGIEFFDAHFFGYSAGEALELDPQKRLLLECAWEAVEDAGYDLRRWPGVIGVFVGAKGSTYIENLRGQGEPGPLAVLGNEKDFLATTLAYKLGLTGPAITVQTACSTALVSVFLGSQALLSYQCDMVLAGAASITLPQEGGYIFEENGVMSPDGHCRAFDDNAHGAAPGNGVAILALKRLQDAIDSGDYIHAVIKGIAINNDGASKVGYTAPSVTGQAQVIAAAMAAAQVHPEQISYIEAHGTGTPLGDTVELAALIKTFQTCTCKKQYCRLGSVKTNIGHTDVVAGAAGLIKTVLALQHRQIPPSLYFETPNSRIDLAASPFVVNAALTEWERDGGPRLAGVSAFGLGGTNAHAIVEEAPVRTTPAPARLPAHLLLLSARGPQSLQRSAYALASHLTADRTASLADIAYTLQVGRGEFEHRQAVLCHDREEAIGKLRSEITWTGRALDQTDIIFMFPGLGDHYVNMGVELYEHFPEFRATIDRCCAFCAPLIGEGPLHTLYPPSRGQPINQSPVTFRDLVQRGRNDDPSDAGIHRTQISHCVLFIVEYALAQLWINLGVRPQAMVGYSLGEYVAACLAGVFSLEDGLRIVAARAKLIENDAPGAMLGAALPPSEAADFVGADCYLAAANTVEMSVFAGTPEAIAELEQKLRARFIATRRLPMTRAVHCPLVAQAAGELVSLLKSIPLRTAAIPYVSNVTGTWITAEQCTDPGHWAVHTKDTVWFSKCLDTLCAGPDKTFLEIGPGQALGSFVLQQNASGRELFTLPSLPYEYESSRGLDFFLESVARLWLSGASVDVARLYNGEQRFRIPLPTYQFDRQRYWVDPAEKPNQSGRGFRKRASVEEWLYVQSWKRSIRSDASSLPVTASSPRRWLVFANDTPLSREILERLSAEGHRVRTVREGQRFATLQDGNFLLNPVDVREYQSLADELAHDRFDIEEVLHLWTARDIRRTDEEERNSGFFSIIYLLQTLRSARSINIQVVSTGTREVTGDELLVPARAMLLPLCSIGSQEYPNVRFRHLDILPAHVEGAAQSIFDDLVRFSPGVDLAYRGRHRWLLTFDQFPTGQAKEVRIKAGGTYLITGGLGKIALALGEHLACEYRPRLLLVALNALPPREQWDRWLSEHGPEDSVSRKLLGVKRLEGLGAEVSVFCADVADSEAMTELSRNIQQQWGAIHGVIHAAGVTSQTSMSGIDRLTPERAQIHFRSKIDGANVLAKLVRKFEPDFCVLMSSLSTVLGGLGMAAYAAANEYLSALALSEARGARTKWLSIDWDTWDIGREDLNPNISQSTLSDLTMSCQQGIRAFMQALQSTAAARIVISIGDLETRLAAWVGADNSPTQAASGGAPATHQRPALATPFVEPRTETETIIAQIWSELLRIERVGIHDNFFQLGGHSLLAIRLIGKLRQEFGVHIHVRQVFESPTIAELAGWLLNRMAELIEVDASVANALPL
jgi:phthiocerol/phenolphthiocerol synthesis type-I polyketide synthase E